MTYRQKFTRRGALVLGTTAVASLALTTKPTWAEPTPAEVRRAINLSGRQRMLSQRMARAACFLRLGLEPSRHLEMLEKAVGLFDVTLAGLRDGSEELGLVTETNVRVLEGIDGVEEIWAALEPAARSIAQSGEADGTEFDTVARGNALLLFTSDNVVDQLVLVYGGSTVGQGSAVSINVAGRQRMLSQKMAKEAGLIGLGMSPDKNRRSLKDSVLLFDQSLTALIEGLPDLAIPAPPDHIRLKLLEVRNIWGEYGEIMQQIVEGGEVGQLELYAIASQADPLLVTMNEAVTLYQDFSGS